MKFPISILLGLCALLAGGYYGFVGASDYTMILRYCIVLEAVSILSFSYCMSCISGVKLVLPFLGVMVAGAILIQAGLRMVHFTDHDAVLKFIFSII
jgi:hypothetical protein